MQSLKTRRLRGTPATWGVSAIVLASVVALVLAYVYSNPPGRQKVVAFYTQDAASIRPGDEVRMAGITVGTVEDLTLEPNQVLVRARLRDDAFVGDQSQVEVRMLTVVGGYYVNVASVGDSPLGAQGIPVQRVTMPYSLIRALTDTTKITENVATAPINESLDDVQKGLTGTNVEALSAVIDAGNSVLSTIERQRGQVSEILNLAKEYTRALNGYREQFIQLVQKVSILSQSLVLYSKGLESALVGLGDAISALKPIADFYEGHRVEFIEKVRQYQYRVRLLVERNGLTVRSLQRVQNLFDRVLNAQNASPGLLATDLCFPIPGSPC